MKGEVKVNTVVRGHVNIFDQDGNTILDAHNAVHPQNMSRVITRALAGEDNAGVYRMAFGNGGTEVDAAYTISYKRPNVGSWDSRLYNETFSKVVDPHSPFNGNDLGSADIQTGTRPGGGSVLGAIGENNVSSIEPDNAIISQVTIRCVLNPGEPKSQHVTDYNPPSTNTDEAFVFDEIGLYSKGRQAIDSAGYQQVDVRTRTSMSDTGLRSGTEYSFRVKVDGKPDGLVSFKTPVSGGMGLGNQILYGDLCQAINTNDPAWQVTGHEFLRGATLQITDDTGGLFPSIEGAETYGYLKLVSNTTGPNSKVEFIGTESTRFFANLVPQGTPLAPVNGVAAGVKNNPTDTSEERERLLAHLIFNPIQKAANRTLYVTYTITVYVVGIGDDEE